jgi:hypothetical protein
MTQRILIGPVVSLVAVGLTFLNLHLGSIVFLTLPFFYLSHPLIDSGWEKMEESSD